MKNLSAALTITKKIALFRPNSGQFVITLFLVISPFALAKNASASTSKYESYTSCMDENTSDNFDCRVIPSSVGECLNILSDPRRSNPYEPGRIWISAFSVQSDYVRSCQVSCDPSGHIKIRSYEEDNDDCGEN